MTQKMETVRVPVGLLPAIVRYMAQNDPGVALFLALQQAEPVAEEEAPVTEPAP